jgi:hypothetical protein
VEQIKKECDVWPTSIIDWTGGDIQHAHLKMWWRMCEDGLPSPALFINPSETTSSSMTGHSQQAWAWARLAGSARRASGPAVDGGGEPRALHLGPSPASNPRTLGTIHQPADKEDPHHYTHD